MTTTKKKAKPFDKLTAILKGKTDKEILDEVAKYPKSTKKPKRCGARESAAWHEYPYHVCYLTKGHKGQHECWCGYRWNRRTRK